MCVLAVALVLLAIYVTFAETTAEVLKLKRTRAPPVLSMKPEHVYHCFVSHLWGTGQDQAAVIKRQLLRMVHGLRIFLDVDDLQVYIQIYVYVSLHIYIYIYIYIYIRTSSVACATASRNGSCRARYLAVSLSDCAMETWVTVICSPMAWSSVGV